MHTLARSLIQGLKAGATLELVEGEGVLVTLRWDPKITSSGGVYLSFLLDDGREGGILIGAKGGMHGSIRPHTGSVNYILESCIRSGSGCSLLMERPKDYVWPLD